MLLEYVVNSVLSKPKSGDKNKKTNSTSMNIINLIFEKLLTLAHVSR